ncbi:MAG: ABC transporter permease [Acidobacteria bacterium]|nr:MAG: ABC transporter permease [Acidobacteriota bacterium]
MYSVVRDTRYAVRQLWKSPTFTIAAILCLGLGIGANTALFSIFNSLLWKPLPVADPGAIVRVFARGRAEQRLFVGFSYPEYQDYSGAGVFDGISTTTGIEAALRTDKGGAARVFAEGVTDNYFEMLGVGAVLGRLLASRPDGSINTEPEAVLSHRFWQLQMDGAPDVIGKTIWLSGAAFTVAGVTPPGFNGTPSTSVFAPQLWVPVGAVPLIDARGHGFLDDRSTRSFSSLIGRLKPGTGVPQAQAALDAVAARLERTYPGSNEGVKAAVFKDLDTRPEVYSSRAVNLIAILFLGLSGLVLVVACANLANLMIARSAARSREIALRLALGAGRGQLVRQLATEAMVLSLAAAAVGMLVAWAAARAISAFRLPVDLPIALNVAIDLRVLLFTLGVSVAAGMAFGLLPAIGASRPNLVPALKGAGSSRPRRRRRFTLTGSLVTAQVAFSLVLLVTAGLFCRSISGARNVDPGIELDRRTLVSFSPSLLHYDAARAAIFQRALLERVRQLPEVEGAALASWIPLGFAADEANFVCRAAETRPDRKAVSSWVNAVTPGYLEAAGVRLVSGRAFTDQDEAGARPVAIVNETFAREAWTGLDTIGRELRNDSAGAPWIKVVGVVADGKYRTLTEPARPYLLRPLSQAPAASVTLVTLNARDAASVISAIRREVNAIDPEMPLLDAKTMEQQMAKVYFLPQAMTALAGPVAALAVFIAAVGLYAVIACSVGQRTREFGIRLAIGASTEAVTADVMSSGLATVGAGLAFGIPAALALAYVIRGALVGVAPTDPTAFFGALTLIGAVSAAASYLPARRASRVDPMVALREE